MEGTYLIGVKCTNHDFTIVPAVDVGPLVAKKDVKPQVMLDWEVAPELAVRRTSFS